METINRENVKESLIVLDAEEVIKLVVMEDISFPPSVSQEHKSVILAAKQPPLRELDDISLIKLITTYIKKAKTMSGHKTADKEIDKAMISLIVDKILAGKFGNLTSMQLEIAIKKGAVGDYGEYMGINAKTLNGWIIAYYKEQLRFRKVQSDFEQKQTYEENQKKKSDHFKENQEEYFLKRFKIEYETLKQRKNYVVFDLNGLFYKWLIKKELLPETNPKRDYYIKQAERKFRENWRHDLKTAGETMTTTINSWLRYTSETIDGKPMMKARFKDLVRRLILVDFMRSAIKDGKEFEQMIKFGIGDIYPRFCGECIFLSITEIKQDGKKPKPPHICKKYKEQVKHNGCHPKLPVLDQCEYEG